MNKITTSILAGVALAALAAAPASAQSTFSNVAGTPLPAFSFGPGNTTYTLSGATAAYNPTNGAAIFGTLSLSGSGLVAGSTYNYNTTNLVFTQNGTGGAVFNESGPTNVSLYTSPTTGVTSYTFSALDGGFSGSGHTGDRLNLSYVAAVPEASTVISFGALLALGGLAVLRRKSVARAS